MLYKKEIIEDNRNLKQERKVMSKELHDRREEIERLNNIINERENTINEVKKYIQDNAYYSINSGTVTLTLENEDFYELEEMLRIG